MTGRTRAASLAASCALALGLMVVPAAQASLLSILPGSCTSQVESQPFAQWGDTSSYTLVPGGNFEPGTAPWSLTGAAAVSSGNESFHVDGASDSHSLSLPSGSSATSPAMCTNIYHPTLRLFLRNAGSSSSRLKVQVLYPGLLGIVQTATVGEFSGSSSWQPSPAATLLLTNVLATLSIDQTAVAFRFTPADSTGAWSIDDVYLDPYARG